MTVIVVGGGICGLGAALLLARDGHDVTLLERDAEPVPASLQDAWESWSRKGVAQFRQPHNFMPGLRAILESELPDVQDALRDAGAVKFDLLNPLPPFFQDRAPRPADDRFWTYSGRRAMGEWVFAKAVEREPHIHVRRGVKVAGLLAGTSVIDSVPHVIGVRTDAGEELIADLVVDVSGRQSRASEWLRALGARPPHEEQEDCGFVYYTRYFHGRQPERRAGALMPIGTISMLTLPGDNETWSVTVFTAAGDQPLKNLRHEDKWTATVRACPLHAHWLDGEPLTGVLPMSGIVDRYRRFVVDGVPVATGFAAVADAWACTNPSAGRGLTVGFLHAVQLRDALRAARGDHRQFAIDFDERTERAIAPWYRAQIAVDRARFAEMDALREGRQPPAPQGLAAAVLGLFAGGFADPDLFRALLEYICTLTPVQTVLGRPAVAARLAAVREAMKDAPPPRPMAGPSREQLLALVG